MTGLTTSGGKAEMTMPGLGGNSTERERPSFAASMPTGPVKAAWRVRPAVVLAMHAAAFTAIYLAAVALRYDGVVTRLALEAALAALPLVVCCKLLAVVATGSHRGWWRLVSFADLIALVEASALGAGLLLIVSLILAAPASISPSVVLVDGAGTVLLLCGARAATRLIRERYGPRRVPGAPRRALVVGADEAGGALVRHLRMATHLGTRAVGFLDADSATSGRMLAGVPVLGSPMDVLRIAAKYRVETVFVPTPGVPARVIRDLVAACEGTGVRVQVVPGHDALISGNMAVRPRDVDIRDLLCRDPVRLDTRAIGEFLRGRVVVVTGGAGSIGSEICRQVLAFGPSRLVLLDHNENALFFRERELLGMSGGCEIVPCVASIADAARLRAVFAEHRPEVVLHAAAHKHVPMMEANPGEAVKNNVFGTRTLVEAALRAGVEAFVMISSDKAVNPTSVMGACKRLAEMVVQSLSGLTGTRLVTVRFGNVLGSAGSVVPIFRDQICDGGPLTVTHPDMTRYFMTIPEAAQLVLQAGALGRGGEIFVLDMGEPVKIVDLARDMIRLSGMEEGREIEIAYTGLRPGEKLFEELYDEAEARLQTSHPKIFLAQHRPCDTEGFWKDLDGLAAQVDRPADSLIATLMKLIPEYRPNRPKTPRPPAVLDTPPLTMPVPECRDPAIPRSLVAREAVVAAVV